MSKLNPRVAHMRRTLLVVGIISFAITANTVQPPPTAAALKAEVAARFGEVKFLAHGRWGSNLIPTSQNFVVTNANNNGPGSLRDAINNANATTGADTITFNIPGLGVKVISLVESLPEITEQVVIDASTQPGYAGTPLIELDGALVGNNSGLIIKAGGSTVRGLAIVRFNATGITLSDCNNNLIQANHIGVDAAGGLKRANGDGIFLSNSSNNVIGGTTVAARNLISGNLNRGVLVSGVGNVIQGNFIGTDVTGKVALGNFSGVATGSTSTSSPGNLIGGTAAGAGNLISGNNSGILGSHGDTIQGNLIGTDITGTSALRNAVGIDASFAENILIGGLVPGARNVISGNLREGVIFGGDGSKLQGNFIGTDVTGTLALGNGDGGVRVSRNPLIGGTVPEARNVIAANGGFGNVILNSVGFDSGPTVQGNYIGTDVTGSRALSPFCVGIRIFGDHNLIGGLVPGAQNVISGNAIGIFVFSSSFFPMETLIQGNLIGLNSLGTGPLPNSQEGILFGNTSGTTVGGTQLEAANKIAFNGGAGIRFMGGNGNAVRGNSIFSNGGLGIDLDPNGVTANDLKDTDTGPNNLQNFPVLTSVVSLGNSTTIQGSLNSTPNGTFQIDFYSSAALDATGSGEGALFLQTTTVNTNGNGDATINVTLPMAVDAGRSVTATATDADGNTSEFSAGNPTGAIGNVQFSVGSIQVHEDLGVLNVTVLRHGGSTGPLTVDFATADGTAIAGQDYTSASGTLSFSDGETSKSFQIPILDDAANESNETFTVVLRNTPNLEALGTPNKLLVTIQDRSSVLVLSLKEAIVIEGSGGGTTQMLFTLSLSAATSRTVSVNYATSDIAAFGGVACGNQGIDYETTAGTATLQPGATSFMIPVKICRDTRPEFDETFRLSLSSPANALLDNDQAFGTILDDDELELLLEDSGPTLTQAAALDATSHLRDPFRVVSLPDWLAAGPDRNTRVVLFARNLQLNPGEAAANVLIFLRASNDQFHDVSAEDVRAVPNTDLTQVVFRLPDNLSAGSCTVRINVHGIDSNRGTIRIVQ